jgi:hypothetical protein
MAHLDVVVGHTRPGLALGESFAVNLSTLDVSIETDMEQVASKRSSKTGDDQTGNRRRKAGGKKRDGSHREAGDDGLGVHFDGIGWVQEEL